MQAINAPARAFGRSCRAQRSRGSTVRVRAEAITIPEQFTKVMPKGDKVLVKAAPAEEKTRGGILLPSMAVRKPTSGDVHTLGDGSLPEYKYEFYLKPGDTVVYSKFGFMFTELKVAGEDYILIKEEDIIGIMPRKNATGDDVPEIRPIGDRVLVKVDEVADVTIGGVVLPDSAKERPLSGTVVRTGPGRFDVEEETKRRPMSVKEGDRILYFKYAGDNMETPGGVKYVVLRQDDILCKA